MCVSQALSLSAVSGGDTDASCGVLAKDTGIGGRGSPVFVRSDRPGALAAEEQPLPPASLATGFEAAGCGAFGDEFYAALSRGF